MSEILKNQLIRKDLLKKNIYKNKKLIHKLSIEMQIRPKMHFKKRDMKA